MFRRSNRVWRKASFSSRPVSRLIRWYIKPGDLTKEFWEKAIQFHETFHGLKITNYFQSPQSFSTPMQQPPYFNSNTTSNNMADFTSQNLPNSPSENEKPYFNLQWNTSYVDFKWQYVYFPFLKTFLDIYLASIIMYNWANTLKHNVVIL